MATDRVYFSTFEELDEYHGEEPLYNYLGTDVLFESEYFKDDKFKILAAKVTSRASKDKIGKYCVFVECTFNDGAACELCTKASSSLPGCNLFVRNNFDRKFISKHLSDDEIVDMAKDQDEDQDAIVTPPNAPKKRVKLLGSRKSMSHMMEKFMIVLEPLNKRVTAIEQSLPKKRKYMVANNLQSIATGMPGKCMVHGNSRGNYWRMNLLKTPTARSTPLSEMNQKVAMNLCCKDCKTGPYIWYLDTQNKWRHCAICRYKACSNGTPYCQECHVPSLQESHATCKDAMVRGMVLLSETVHEIKDVQTHCEFFVTEKHAIDFVVEITTASNKKHMYAIEILCTKKENILTFSKKFRMARNMLSPDKSYMMAFDISSSQKSESLPLQYKIDVLRRWIIFTVLYSRYLPNITNWWFFCKENAYALNGKTWLTEFYKTPIRVNKAPKNMTSDWEFQADIYSGFEMLEEDQEDINTFMFGGIFEEGKSNTYKLYDIRKHLQDLVLTPPRKEPEPTEEPAKKANKGKKGKNGKKGKKANKGK